MFSSLWEQLIGFTRDYDSVRAALVKVEEYNKTCIQTGLAGATSLLSTEWGVKTPSQVNMVRTGPGNLGKSLNLKNKNPALKRPGILLKVLESSGI